MVGTGVSSEVDALLRLNLLPGLGTRRIAALVGRHGSGVAALEAVRGQRDLFGRENEVPSMPGWEGRGIKVLPMTAPDYPPCFHELTDPPPLLFLRGRLSFLHGPAVAVVGARKSTETGRSIAESLGRVLGAAGFTVVSGMARGVDGAAHRGALAVGGKTLAVLGSGLDVVYPPVHRALFRQMEKSGLLVSEFLPGEQPLPHHFPKRNRLIAALAQAIIVVEAGKRSGALITVDHGLDLGREILAVPGSPLKPQSRGTNALIRDGARLVQDPEQIVSELPERLVEALPQPPRGVDGSSPRAGSRGLGPSSEASLPSGLRPLWESLDQEPLSADALARQVGLSPGEALAGLSALELLGLARRCPGMRFCRD